MVNLSSSQLRRDLITEVYHSAIETCAPDRAVSQAISRTPKGFAVDGVGIPVVGRLVVVAVGKAAAPMAAATESALGDLIDRGVVLTKDGHADAAPTEFEVFEASHPVPDLRGIEASKTILAAVESLGKNDVVLLLISGGGSALFEAPVDGVSLADLQIVTDLLLRAGAPIQDLNAVRSELSLVKGGGFRRRIGDATTISLILSDVLGNSPDVIASGPTIPRRSDPSRALNILQSYELGEQVPKPVLTHLNTAISGDPSGQVPDDGRDVFRIIGDNNLFVDAVMSRFQEHDLSVDRVWREYEGEARERAVEWVNAVEHSNAEAVIGGGELTVAVKGSGVGGRNTEFALAAAIALHGGDSGVSIASLASDGQDGGVDAAGAVVDAGTVNALNEAGVNAAEALENNDSGPALEKVGALVVPGPTGTNVNDVYIGLKYQS